MIPEERLQSIVEEVAKYFNFKSWTLYQKQLDETIENYFGVLVPITINGIGDSGEENRSVFIKIPPIEQSDALKSVIRQHYEVEIHTYSTLLPIYRSISKLDTSILIPECYYLNLEKNNEVLVLQDMTCSGYRKYAGGMSLDFEHVILSLKALANFHCLSIIFKEKGFDFYADIMKPYKQFHPEMYYIFIKNILEQIMDLFGDSKYQVYLKKLTENLGSYINNSTSGASYLVYGHGDFWRENILFKYENEKPVRVCLLDFQKSRIMSPAQDILLFLLGNTEAALRRKHNKYFLDVYLTEFHSNLRENGLNTAYSMENLIHDLRVVAPYSIAISTMSYWLWFGLENDGIVKSKNACNEDHRNIAVLRFKSRVVDMLEDLSHFSYITL